MMQSKLKETVGVDFPSVTNITGSFVQISWKDYFAPLYHNNHLMYMNIVVTTYNTYYCMFYVLGGNSIIT